MSSDNSPESFAKQERAVIVAPAGYGKTELIAQSVACCEGRQLVLTHTHAGVDSLRQRLKEKYGISASCYKVETIHSFALRFARSYPKTTGLTVEYPQAKEDFPQVISSALLLFDTKIGKDILKATYSGIFVDEYQDCEISQHQLICKIATILPCRIVGDPLQGIYDFGGTRIVDWENDVEAFFNPLPALEIPYRWKNTNPLLGEKLKEVRQKLLAGERLKFKHTEKDTYIDIIKLLYKKRNSKSIYVICEPSPEGRYFPHTLAESLRNLYYTIEPLTNTDLFLKAGKIERAKGNARVRNVMDFANLCLTKVSTESNEVYFSLTKQKKNFSKERKKKLEQFSLNVKTNDAIKYVLDLLVFYEQEYQPTYKRRQLWKEMKSGLHEVICGGSPSLEEAVWVVRNRSRYMKGRIPKHCISRTVLIKGLECDHAIIVRPELFDAKNLYVALTRASSKVTIISNENSWCNYPVGSEK